MSADQDKAYDRLMIAGDTENVVMGCDLGTHAGNDKFRKLVVSLAYNLGAALTRAVIDMAGAIREGHNRE